MRKEIIVDIIVGIFVMLFLYTGSMKLIDQDIFRSSFGKSPLPYQLTPFLVWLIPTIELLTAGMLLVPRLRKLGLYNSFALMALFTGYVGYMIFFLHGHLPCGCGGIIQAMSWHQHLYVNSALLILSIIGLVLDKKIALLKFHNNSAEFSKL